MHLILRHLPTSRDPIPLQGSHIRSSSRDLTFKPQYLAEIAWAYATTKEIAAHILFDDVITNALVTKQDEFTENELLKCHDAFILLSPTKYLLQRDVISEMTSMGLEPDEEVLTEEMGYRLDALVAIDGEKIGIEVDGPSHFAGRKPTGSTLLKRRQVNNLDGIQVVSVPYWEWNRLRKNSNMKQAYLRSLLDLEALSGPSARNL
ncbi:hypothetical protein ACHAWF_001464 [Thalassiosira exigua]